MSDQKPCLHVVPNFSNKDLESGARWADQCNEGQGPVLVHDTVRSKLDGTPVGQNVYVSGSTAPSSQAALTAAAAVPAQADTPFFPSHPTRLCPEVV
jgi:hypothetical protein